MGQYAAGNTKARLPCCRKRSYLLRNEVPCYYSHQLEAEMQALEKDTSVEVNFRG